MVGWRGIWCNTSTTPGEADWRRCRAWWSGRRERNRECEIKKQKKQKRVRQGEAREDEKNTLFYVLFFFQFFQFTSCLNSGWSRVESLEKEKKKRNSSRIPCDCTADEAKPLPQLEETNLTHLWIPFNLQKKKKKISLQEKKQKNNKRTKTRSKKHETASPRHLTQWTLQRSHCKVAFMCWDGTTRRKSRLKGRRVQRKTRWLTWDLFVFSANRMRGPSPVNVFVPDRKPRR